MIDVTSLIREAMPTAVALGYRYCGAALPSSKYVKDVWTHVPITRDDIEMSALEGAWEAAQRFDPDCGISWQVYRWPRMRGQAIDDLREWRVRETAVDPATLDRLQGEWDWTLDHQDEVRFLLRNLSPKDRDLVLLVYYFGLSMREAGALKGLSESRVSQRLSKTRERLKRAGQVVA